MREILFRGKRLDNGEWVEGVPFAGYMICGMTTAYYDDEVPMSEYREFEYVEVDPATVGQYTGLTDKNGKNIFEGDVLTGRTYLYPHELENGQQFDYEGFVEWGVQCDVGLCWFLTDTGKSGSWELRQTVHRNAIDFSTGEIIGNIHDQEATPCSTK